MKMNLKEMRKQLQKDNQKYPVKMVPVPKREWPATTHPPVEVWRSSLFLAQVYEDNGAQRVSCNRTMINDDGRWSDKISWDELMEVKRQIGRGNELAVEVLPADKDVVNVANMRHFWIIPGLKIGWEQ